MQYKYHDGLCFMRNAGFYLPQIHAWQAGKHVMTDDVLFPRVAFSPPFKLLVLADSVSEALGIESKLSSAEITNGAQGLLDYNRAVYLIHGNSESADKLRKNHLLAMTAKSYKESGFKPDLPGYNSNRIRDEVKAATFVVVREDRFVFGTCSSISDLQCISKNVAEAFFVHK